MLRERIIDQYGEGCRIRQVRQVQRFRSSLFVADVTQGARLIRMLGAIGQDGVLTEQSAMDLLRPERLVFLYERLMLVALALVERPAAILQLGLGGGAMCRHLDAYLPDCQFAVIEHDPAVIELARRHFHIRHPVRRGDAQEIVAERPAAWDVILVDLYDGRSTDAITPRFWEDCAQALKPGGCLAVNWAAFLEDALARSEAARAAAVIGRAFFAGPRALSENVVQLAPLDPRLKAADIAPRWRRFAEAHRLPREDRDVLKRCTLRAEYPSPQQRR